jgi:hypothetical protein
VTIGSLVEGARQPDTTAIDTAFALRPKCRRCWTRPWMRGTFLAAGQSQHSLNYWPCVGLSPLASEGAFLH